MPLISPLMPVPQQGLSVIMPDFLTPHRRTSASIGDMWIDIRISRQHEASAFINKIGILLCKLRWLSAYIIMPHPWGIKQ